MAADGDSFSVDLESTEQYLEPVPRSPGREGEAGVLIDRLEAPDQFLSFVRASIAKDRSRTENKIAVMLVLGVLLSLPLYWVAVWLLPESTDVIENGFDKWLTVVSALAGAAVGIGALNKRPKDSEA